MSNISNFFNDDYISFAAYDNLRKIPSVIDGLKISQRKVLYTILKNNIDSENKEIKVEQLSAKTSEQTQYLHGAGSLNGVAVGLATKYIGSNNINLLEPDGNFGTRFVKESSAPRYIYTYLSNIAKKIFRKEDENVLEAQHFEGSVIEPKNYYPIIPMVLVNGTEGLSVGFSSNISPKNPLLIIEWLINKLKNKKSNIEFLPFYNGFKGTIQNDINSAGRYIIKGDFIQENLTKLIITEIPIKYNLKSYIKVLDSLCEKDIIKSYKDLSDNDEFKFEVKVTREFTQNKTKDDILQTLKLIETISDNLTLLDSNGKVKEYNNINEILEEYYNIRYNVYNKRKEYQLNQIKQEFILNYNKKLFIEGVLNNKINIRDSVNNVISQIESLNISKVDNSYDYLLDMKISSFTKEKLLALLSKIKNLNDEYEILKNNAIENIWISELKELRNELLKIIV